MNLFEHPDDALPCRSAGIGEDFITTDNVFGLCHLFAGLFVFLIEFDFA
ncbi:hypothetical protein SPFM13_00001 [Salmonella phage SPFM13]|nr:hypothetical protein SPFM13_00001 [Salmonella phage SPFM13]